MRVAIFLLVIFIQIISIFLGVFISLGLFNKFGAELAGNLGILCQSFVLWAPLIGSYVIYRYTKKINEAKSFFFVICLLELIGVFVIYLVFKFS
jgi:hypothetical protein